LTARGSNRRASAASGTRVVYEGQQSRIPQRRRLSARLNIIRPPPPGPIQRGRSLANLAKIHRACQERGEGANRRRAGNVVSFGEREGGEKGLENDQQVITEPVLRPARARQTRIRRPVTRNSLPEITSRRPIGGGGGDAGQRAPTTMASRRVRVMLSKEGVFSTC